MECHVITAILNGEQWVREEGYPSGGTTYRVTITSNGTPISRVFSVA